jgi:replicative DNA helicase
MLKYEHLSKGVQRTKEYIRQRNTGESRSLLTSKPTLNATLMDGIDWNRIMTIGGLSGSGKSTILEELKRDFCTLNEVDFLILSFEFEMLIEDQLARSISPKVNKSVKELYTLDSNIDGVMDALDQYNDMPIYFVDNIGTVQDVRETIVDFVTKLCKPEKKNVIITLDHLLLTKGKRGDEEKEVIDDLMRAFVELKKYISSLGIKCLFVTLSQMNRNIEAAERILNPLLHYPNKNDLFAASSTYYCSDYVIITHRPATISGITRYYGPPTKNHKQGLPLRSSNGKDLIYWHVIKERFGSNNILVMEEDFKYSRLNEYELEI